MSLFAFAPRALACVVGIALLTVNGNSAFAQADPLDSGLEFDVSESSPELNAKFRPQEGWIGGDGAQSIDLGNNRTLWLFNDSWVGTVKDGRRSRARIIHNSAGIQCGPEAPCTFIVREGAQKKPVDLISPADGRGWLSFLNGVMVKDRLYLFLSQFDMPTDHLRPDRTPLGQWLAVVENPQDDPRDWCVSQVRMPFNSYTRRRDVTYGSGAVVDGKYLYVYGCDDATRLLSQNRYLTVARVPLDQIEDMSKWRFQRDGRWTRDFMRADRISDYMSSDLSVAYMPGLKRYLMVYTDCDISNRIVARTSPSPTGPWSNYQTLHTCREGYGDAKLYCYAGKAHPTLSSDGKLVISYLTTSIDTWQVAMDARLYWPTFVTVGMREAHPGTEAVAGVERPQGATAE
jgi:hypothetical protein